MIDVILDTLLDNLKLLPFLFLTFLLIEFIEHKVDSSKIISKARGKGPIIGGLLGAIPQCGFSVSATEMYATRIISLGTLISVYLSTSDEMLPILISNEAPISLILTILAIKIIVGITMGIIIDFILRKTKKEENTVKELCHDEHCACEHSIFLGALKHTLKILLYLLIITFILNTLLYFIGTDNLTKIFLKDSIFGPFVSSAVGLIPNCAASILITSLYLSNTISFASLIAGLLTNCGIGLLTLYKSNKNLKENILITLLLYVIGVVFGIAIGLIISLF